MLVGSKQAENIVFNVDQTIARAQPGQTQCEQCKWYCTDFFSQYESWYQLLTPPDSYCSLLWETKKIGDRPGQQQCHQCKGYSNKWQSQCESRYQLFAYCSWFESVATTKTCFHFTNQSLSDPKPKTLWFIPLRIHTAHNTDCCGVSVLMSNESAYCTTSKNSNASRTNESRWVAIHYSTLHVRTMLQGRCSCVHTRTSSFHSISVCILLCKLTKNDFARMLSACTQNQHVGAHNAPGTGFQRCRGVHPLTKRPHGHDTMTQDLRSSQRDRYESAVSGPLAELALAAPYANLQAKMPPTWLQQLLIWPWGQPQYRRAKLPALSVYNLADTSVQQCSEGALALCTVPTTDAAKKNIYKWQKDILPPFKWAIWQLAFFSLHLSP